MPRRPRTENEPEDTGPDTGPDTEPEAPEVTEPDGNQSAMAGRVNPDA